MYKHFVKNGKSADASTLIRLMEGSFATARFEQVGGKAIENAQKFRKPVAYEGHLHFDTSSSPDAPAFMIEDASDKYAEKVVLLCEHGIWYAR